MSLWAYDMAVSVNQILANTLGLADPLGRVADDGRVGFNGRVNINGRPIRFAPNFDGVDDYGVLANRAINVDNDIVIEWEQKGVSKTGNAAVITQCDSSTLSSREFVLRYLSGVLEMSIGGTTIFGVASSINSADGLWKVSLVGPNLIVSLNGVNLLSAGSRVRGASREPSAPTRIGVRFSGASPTEFLSGAIYNIRINDVLWRMDQRNQAIQPSTPAGNNMTLSNVAADRWQEVKQ